MTLDKSNENDTVLSKRNVRYLVNKDLLKRCGKITVDFVEEDNWQGFEIISENRLGGQC